MFLARVPLALSFAAALAVTFARALAMSLAVPEAAAALGHVR
jgi:hypothetical protein